MTSHSGLATWEQMQASRFACKGGGHANATWLRRNLAPHWDRWIATPWRPPACRKQTHTKTNTDVLLCHLRGFWTLDLCFGRAQPLEKRWVRRLKGTRPVATGFSSAERRQTETRILISRARVTGSNWRTLTQMSLSFYFLSRRKELKVDAYPWRVDCFFDI